LMPKATWWITATPIGRRGHSPQSLHLLRVLAETIQKHASFVRKVSDDVVVETL